MKNYDDSEMLTNCNHYLCILGRPIGLTVFALTSGLSSPDSSPVWGHCIVFLDEKLYPYRTSLHQVYKASKVHAESTPAMDCIPSRRGAEILLDTSLYKDPDKLWPEEPFGFCTHNLIYAYCDKYGCVAIKQSYFKTKIISCVVNPWLHRNAPY